MTLQITKLPAIEWRDCNNGYCDEDAIYQIENMLHGALIYSCKEHLINTIEFEMEFNQR